MSPQPAGPPEFVERFCDLTFSSERARGGSGGAGGKGGKTAREGQKGQQGAARRLAFFFALGRLPPPPKRQRSQADTHHGASQGVGWLWDVAFSITHKERNQKRRKNKNMRLLGSTSRRPIRFCSNFGFFAPLSNFVRACLGVLAQECMHPPPHSCACMMHSIPPKQSN